MGWRGMDRTGLLSGGWVTGWVAGWVDGGEETGERHGGSGLGGRKGCGR